VPLHGDAQLANECATAAFKQGQAFWVIYDGYGLDSHTQSGIAMNQDGVVTFLSYDGDPGGGGSDDNPVIVTRACTGASLHVSEVAAEVGDRHSRRCAIYPRQAATAAGQA